MYECLLARYKIFMKALDRGKGRTERGHRVIVFETYEEDYLR